MLRRRASPWRYIRTILRCPCSAASRGILESRRVERAFEIAPSHHHGLDLCLGTWSETGENVLETIEHFGTQDRIVYIHFRDVQGSVPKFQECFLREGNLDPVEVMIPLKRIGFRGSILDDHTPRIVDDTVCVAVAGRMKPVTCKG